MSVSNLLRTSPRTPLLSREQELAADAATAKNVLAAGVEGQTVRFFVNDAEVESLPRSELVTAGTVGLRVNHNVNIHITTLDYPGYHHPGPHYPKRHFLRTMTGDRRRPPRIRG